MTTTTLAQNAAETIRQQGQTVPRVGVVLGTGLGELVDLIESTAVIPYEQLAGFPRTTAMGHRGQLICGRVGEVPLIAMQGRFHRYEGYSISQVAHPIRVMQQLGIEFLIVSNASGGVHPRLSTGDILVIDDHINLMWQNPLIGPHDDALGSRFPDLCAPYDPLMIEMAHSAAQAAGFRLQQGVYAAVTGPNYETRAEYRMLRRMGADVVGMSTVPEVLVAVQAGMRVIGLSVVTNVCRPDGGVETSGEDVVSAAEQAGPRMRSIVHGVLNGVRALLS